MCAQRFHQVLASLGVLSSLTTAQYSLVQTVSAGSREEAGASRFTGTVSVLQDGKLLEMVGASVNHQSVSPPINQSISQSITQ